MLSFAAFSVLQAHGQTPFVTDDTDVTPKGHFHLEVGNELDWLQRSDFPSLRQNELLVELDYGLLDRVEIGIQAPLLTIFNAPAADFRRPTGIGDANFSVKYNFPKEREHSRQAALSLAFNIQIPTGNVNRELGSGLTDYYGNGVIQKSLTKKTTLRLNGGILFAGDLTTGAEGIRIRGLVFTGGGSLVKQFTPKFDFGFELTAAVTKNFQLDQGQLQTLVGGNYALRKNMTFDFGVVAGKFAASPRAGFIWESQSIGRFCSFF
jgi:hypothetical protein